MWGGLVGVSEVVENVLGEARLEEAFFVFDICEHGVGLEQRRGSLRIVPGLDGFVPLVDGLVGD